MYVGSAADAAGLQAIASAAAAARWGTGPPGREVIAHPVCKGKYQPWKAGVRQYGCFRHHALRQAKVLKHGVREGWASFEQWPRPAAAPGDALSDCAGAQCSRQLPGVGKAQVGRKRARTAKTTAAAAAAAAAPSGSAAAVVEDAGPKKKSRASAR